MVRERRKFYRAPHAFEVRYRLLDDLTTSWRTVTLVNLGAGGLRFRDSETLEKGALLELQLQLPSGREPLRLKGHVVWHQLHASGVNEVGVEFVDVAAQDQLHIDNVVQFLRKSTPPPTINP